MNSHARYQRMAAATSTLTPRECNELATHLDGCTECRVRAEAYQLQDHALHDALLQCVPPRSALPSVLASGQEADGRKAPYRVLTRVPLALLALPVLIALTTVALAAGGVIHVYRPETPASPGTLARLFYAPALPPYQDVRYRTLDPSTAARQSGYAVAYIRNPPSDVSTTVGVDISPHVGWPATTSGPQPSNPELRGLAVAIRSIIRYHGTVHTVVVALDEPSPKAIQTRELMLGERTVSLPNGQNAWTSNDVSGTLPFVRPPTGSVHVLAWVSGHYVVTIFSDLPFTRLERLATRVVVVPPVANASKRAIPVSWPTPMALQPLPAKLDVRVDGSALWTSKGTQLEVRYLFNFGSYSQGALYGLDKWSNVSIQILFPRALRARTHDPQRHQNFSGGGVGMGGSVTFSTAGMSSASLKEALRQGLAIHVAWTEKGRHRHQTFRYRIIPASECNRADPSCAIARSIR